MGQHITHDPIYNVVSRDDFAAMIEVDRYADRTDAFDHIISSTVASVSTGAGFGEPSWSPSETPSGGS